MAPTEGKKRIFKIRKNSAVFWGYCAMLTIFWLLLAWSLHYQQIIVGFVMSWFLVSLNRDILLGKEERPQINPKTILKSGRYLIDLIIAVFIANIEVAKIVIQPKMPISPGIVRFRSKAKKNLTKVALANSITLTPGTLTLDIENDVFIIHCLTRANAEDVVDWGMEKKLLALEKAGEFGG